MKRVTGQSLNEVESFLSDACDAYSNITSPDSKKALVSKLATTQEHLAARMLVETKPEVKGERILDTIITRTNWRTCVPQLFPD